MKKLHFFLLAISLLELSCKKDKEDSSINLTCKIDGVEKTFNVDALAAAETQAGVSRLIMMS